MAMHLKIEQEVENKSQGREGQCHIEYVWF